MPETTNGTLPSSDVTFDVVPLIIQMFLYPTCDGHGNFQNIPRYEGFYEMGRNVRDKFKKKFKMPSRKEKYIILSIPLYGCAFLQKLMFPSILNK